MSILKISIREEVGSFAENKDKARDLRIDRITPALIEGQTVTLDFDGVTSATQSFVHALISEIMREFGAEVLDQINFKNCNPTVRKIIQIVTEYMQQSGAA